MKIRLFSLVIMIIFMMSFISGVYSIHGKIIALGSMKLIIGDPNFTVSSTEKEIDPGRGTVPVIISSRTLLPIRAVIEAMGGKIEWNESEKKVTINANNNTIELWMTNPQYKEELVFMGVDKPYEALGFHEGSKTMMVNGQEMINDVAPIILNQRTFMPLRFVVENVGADVSWDGEEKSVTITYVVYATPTPAPTTPTLPTIKPTVQPTVQPTTITPTQKPTTQPTPTPIVTGGAIPAFPGAEGFGMWSMGGRGGDVYHVTNLNDSGIGSLRYGIESANGPRTIVFDVSGTIMLVNELKFDKPNMTVAGQTAPGDGITLGGESVKVRNSNIIIRYIRCRLGDQGVGDDDSLSIQHGSNIIIDHVSASWSIDETLSNQSENVDLVTVQWCLISESLNESHHEKGSHGYGGIIGGIRQTYHHNLYAHHTSRNPKVTWRQSCTVDFRNNVIYNWLKNTCYDGATSNMNWVNNYYKAGPATKSGVRARIFELESANPPSALYAEGNYVDGFPGITQDNWSGGIDFGEGGSEANRAYEPFDCPAITQQTAQEAYQLVLADAGASLARDSIDTRIANEVETGTYTYGNFGIIDSQDDVGGWPTLNSLPAPLDTDQDGMPDDWENANNLDPNDPQDRNDDLNGDGYTNLEEYLNSLVDEETPTLYPSQVLDLTNWKINLPIGDAKQIKQPELDTFEHVEYFHTVQDDYGNGVLFKAHCGGGTTPNTKYPRSELREMTNNGVDRASWSTTSGTHTMYIEQKITHTPVAKPHIIAGQIHDGDDVIVIRLEGEKLFIDMGGDDGPVLEPNYVLGTVFNVEFVASGGSIKIFYNGVEKHDYVIDTSGCYFKAGAYTQSNTSKGDEPDAYGEVVIYDLQVTHS